MIIANNIFMLELKGLLFNVLKVFNASIIHKHIKNVNKIVSNNFLVRRKYI